MLRIQYLSHVKDMISLTFKGYDIPHMFKIYIDYLMVGLRYGFYPRVTDVILRTSEVRASE